MKRMTRCWAAMAMLVIGVAACGSGITGPDIPTPPFFEEAEESVGAVQGP